MPYEGSYSGQIGPASAAAAIAGQSVLAASIMAGGAYVALPVAGLVGMEVVERPSPALRHRSTVAVVRIVAVIDVAPEAVRAVEPGAGSDKDAAIQSGP
ncbi:MAG: hypothetical protein WBX18_12815 [Terracidiphilus sp.]